MSLRLSYRRPGFSRLPRPLQLATRDLVVRCRYRGLSAADVTMHAYPKSGSTWLRFVLASALTSKDVDFNLIERIVPAVGAQRRAPSVLPNDGRLLMSHERPRSVVLGNRPPSVYLVRDGRDVAVSCFHHLHRRGVQTGPFPSFLDLFLTGRVNPYGTWHDHVRRWSDLARRSPHEVLIVRYEDLLDDPVPTLTRVFWQFGWPVSEETLRWAATVNAPDAMRAKETSSQRLRRTSVRKTPFVRSATAGGWRRVFDDASLEKFESAAGRELAAFGYELTTADATGSQGVRSP